MPKAYPLFKPECAGVFGGAEVDLYLLGTELAKDGRYAVSFVVADYGQADEECFGAVRVIKSVDFKKNALSGVMRIWKAMRQARSDIYVQMTMGPGTVLTALFCTVYKRAFIYRTANEGEAAGEYITHSKAWGTTFAWALRRARCVVVQTEKDRENLQNRMGIQGEVLRNAQYMPAHQERSRTHVLWVGRSARIKRPELFIELARNMPEEECVMICQQATGDNRYGELVEAARAVKNLRFIEKVAAVDEYFAEAKVFVNTSDSEGWPHTFVEACKYGVAIASLNVNPDGLLDKYGCGLFGKGDWEGFAESLKRMLAEMHYIEAGHNSEEYARKNHDLTITIEAYKKLFEGIHGADSEG